MRIALDNKLDEKSVNDTGTLPVPPQPSTATAPDVAEQKTSSFQETSYSINETYHVVGDSGENEHQMTSGEDLLNRIQGMYRLLDLVNEEGSGGIGKSNLLSTHWVSRALQWTKSSLIKSLWLHSPIPCIPDPTGQTFRFVAGYSSMTIFLIPLKIDFHALDTHTIRPLGIYGSSSAIVKFLDELGKLDQDT
jgi:hypothetical protein